MHLSYRDKQGVDKRFDLGADPVVVGRVPECDVVLGDERVSRFHCEIRAWGPDFAIRDLGSHNGTLINGSPIEIAILKPGDEISVGGVIVVVEHDDGDGYRNVLSQIVKGIE